MNRVLASGINICVLVHHDHILILSNSFEEYWDDLTTALEILRAAKQFGVTHKCELLKTEVEYLEFDGSDAGVHACREKIKAIVG